MHCLLKRIILFTYVIFRALEDGKTDLNEDVNGVPKYNVEFLKLFSISIGFVLNDVNGAVIWPTVTVPIRP